MIVKSARALRDSHLTEGRKGSSAYDDHGVVQNAVRAIKDALPELYVITDVCMCEYTNHGHCGIIEG